MSNSALAHEPAAALRGVRRSLFLAELGVCFGPCSVMALASVLTFGPAVGLVLQKLFGTIEPFNDVPWWAAIQPIFLSVGAFAGLFALQAVARALLAGGARLAHPPWAMTLMALAGIAAIVVVGVQVVPEQPGGLPAILCVYAPLLATAHIVFISRRLLFKGPR
jgi:hypothetical protein